MRFIVICQAYFFLAVLSGFAASSETEAGAFCTGAECLKLSGVQAGEMQDLCQHSLPQHCQEIPKKFTICQPDDTGFIGTSGYSLFSCLEGAFTGLADAIHTGIQVIGGAWSFLTSSETRAEAWSVTSFMAEELAGPYGAEILEELFVTPVLEEVDEITQCLNYRGRWEYVCESGVQIFAAVKAVKWGKKLADPKKMNLVQKIALIIRRRANRPKISVQEKIQQRKQLKQLFKSGKKPAKKKLSIAELTPYQISLLSKRQIQKHINLSKLTDAQVLHLSTRQLQAVPVQEIAKVNPLALEGSFSQMNRVGLGKNLKPAGSYNGLRRLSDKQFQAVMEHPSASAISAESLKVKEVISRISPKQIPRLRHLSGVPLGSLSLAQIRTLSRRQIAEFEQKDLKFISPLKKRAFKRRKQSLDGGVKKDNNSLWPKALESPSILPRIELQPAPL